jgi:hypothetical protein
MREIFFLDEKNFWLEDDDTDFHVRAFYEKKWITGFIIIVVVIALFFMIIFNYSISFFYWDEFFIYLFIFLVQQ